jgi:DNA-binding beta-propeller fold protein YncE
MMRTAEITEARMKFCHYPIALAALAGSSVAAASPDYRLSHTIPLGAPDRWDYAVFDPVDARLYVAHGDRLSVVAGRTGEIVGTVEGIAGGTHGTAISHATGQGFTDDGRAGTAVAFDLATLKITHSIKADDDADAIALDPRTGHVFVVEGDPGALTVIDPKTDKPIAAIKAGEKMEYAVAGDGTVYAAGEANSDLIRIDTRTNRVTAHWPTPDCKSPHGLAFDRAGKRLFMGCANATMMVVDAVSGRVVAELPIGRGNDATAYDPSHRRVFSSNGIDGTVSVYQQVSADTYRPLATIRTKVSGRTMAVDPQSGRLFVIAADTDPAAEPGGRAKPQPGTLSVLVFDPAA